MNSYASGPPLMSLALPPPGSLFQQGAMQGGKILSRDEELLPSSSVTSVGDATFPPKPTTAASDSIPRPNNAFNKSFISLPFPVRLFTMLNDADEQGFSHIISWNNEGNGFLVKDKDAFMATILPRYAKNCTKYKSYQRQLNLYGFLRIEKGPNKGTVYHELFQRGDKRKVNLIERDTSPVKSRSAIATASKKKEIFASTPSSTSTPFPATSSATSVPVSSDYHPRTLSVVSLDNNVEVNVPSPTPFAKDNIPWRDSHETMFEQKVFFPVEDHNSNETNSGSDDRSLLDLDLFLEEAMMDGAAAETARATVQVVPNFAFKLYDLLEAVKQNTELSRIVSWSQQDISFQIKDPEAFCSMILPLQPCFFGMFQPNNNSSRRSCWEMFQQQLEIHEFKCIRDPASSSVTFFHPYFAKSRRQLCENIKAIDFV